MNDTHAPQNKPSCWEGGGRWNVGKSTVRFHCLQYINDTVPCASQGDVPIVVNKHQISAVSKYGQNQKYFPLWSCQNVLFTTSRLPPNSWRRCGLNSGQRKNHFRCPCWFWFFFHTASKLGTKARLGDLCAFLSCSWIRRVFLTYACSPGGNLYCD